MTRDERQELVITNWIKAKGVGTLVAATGFGKTRVATNIIDRYLIKNKGARVLIVVPSKVLQKQWIDILTTKQLIDRCQVEVINTVIKHVWDFSLLILDEVHRFASPSFRKVFSQVKHNHLLCLTATINRLDGLDFIIQHYAPIFDEVSLEECLRNKWVSQYNEYKILLNVDLTEYTNINQEFLKHFSFFNYDLSEALNCVQFPPSQYVLARRLGISVRIVKAHTYSFMRLLKKRKDWVMNHPKKLEIAKKILSHRVNKKVLTFSSSIEQAKSLGEGYIIHHKISKKNRERIIEEFNKAPTGVIHSIDSLKEGADIEGVSTAVLVAYNSSMLKKIQTVGRVIRYSEGKIAEVFTLLIKNTVEEQWFAKSSKDVNYLTLEENDLDTLLTGDSLKEESEILYLE